MVFIVQWLAWIFHKGRFGKPRPNRDTPDVRHVLADLLVKIINDFRHLLAGAIVLLFGLALAYSLAQAANVDEISTVLQAVGSSLGGLIGAIIGYYFGESAGMRQGPPPSSDATAGEPEQSENADTRSANLRRPTNEAESQDE